MLTECGDRLTGSVTVSDVLGPITSEAGWEKTETPDPVFGPNLVNADDAGDADEEDSADTRRREARARRAVRRTGLLMRKSRGRAHVPNLDDLGGYMLVDENNYIVAGARFDLSLDDLERYAGTSTWASDYAD